MNVAVYPSRRFEHRLTRPRNPSARAEKKFDPREAVDPQSRTPCRDPVPVRRGHAHGLRTYLPQCLPVLLLSCPSTIVCPSTPVSLLSHDLRPATVTSDRRDGDAPSPIEELQDRGSIATSTASPGARRVPVETSGGRSPLSVGRRPPVVPLLFGRASIRSGRFERLAAIPIWTSCSEAEDSTRQERRAGGRRPNPGPPPKPPPPRLEHVLGPFLDDLRNLTSLILLFISCLISIFDAASELQLGSPVRQADLLSSRSTPPRPVHRRRPDEAATNRFDGSVVPSLRRVDLLGSPSRIHGDV